MPVPYPYVNSPGALSKTILQLRRSFPATVDVRTLQKLGIAPKNESYIINTLRFLGMIDADGNRVVEKTKCFNEHNDEAFQRGFAELVESSFQELFTLHGHDAWLIDSNKLIAFFRTSAQSSDTVGRLQARTFTLLGELCGHSASRSDARTNGKEPGGATTHTKRQARPRSSPQRPTSAESIAPMDRDRASRHQVGLTVRIEVNLPSQGDQETYDRIFRSIRENLIHGA